MSSSCEVARGDDDAHPAHAEDALHAVLAREDVALLDSGNRCPLSQVVP